MTVQFSEKGELGSIRQFCQGTGRHSAACVDFRAQLVHILPGGMEEVVESMTLDAGGVTGRLLTGAWKTLFEGSPVSDVHCQVTI